MKTVFSVRKDDSIVEFKVCEKFNPIIHQEPPYFLNSDYTVEIHQKFDDGMVVVTDGAKWHGHANIYVAIREYFYENGMKSRRKKWTRWSAVINEVDSHFKKR